MTCFPALKIYETLYGIFYTKLLNGENRMLTLRLHQFAIREATEVKLNRPVKKFSPKQ